MSYLTYSFLQNKYHACYVRLIQRCQTNPIKEMPGYTECHHILPRSLGCQDVADNMVILTTKEHFIAHALLIRFTEGLPLRNMRYAFQFMCDTRKPNRRTWSGSRLYVANRLALSKTPMSQSHKDAIAKSLLGMKRTNVKPFTQKHKDNIGIANRGKRKPYGPMSQSHKDAIKSATLGKPRKPYGPMTQEHKNALSLSQKGKKRGPHTESATRNQSLAQTGKKRGTYRKSKEAQQ